MQRDNKLAASCITGCCWAAAIRLQLTW